MIRNTAKFLTLSADALELALAPDLGGSIVSFRRKMAGDRDSIDILRGWDAEEDYNPFNMASFPLTPFSNRIINCRLSFDDQEHYIGPAFGDEPHQLHGNGWRQPWRVLHCDERRAVLELKSAANAETPYAYTAVQEFALEEEGLAITLTVTNNTAQPLPFGLGHHFYFPRNDHTVFTAHLPQVWQSDRLVPHAVEPVPAAWNFSQGLTMGDKRFSPPRHGFKGNDLMDHCFQGWDGRAMIEWPEHGLQLVIQADKTFQNFVIYIPEKKPYFCAEPVSNINDGFNLQARGVKNTGTVVLAEGESLSGTVLLKVLKKM